MAASIAARDTRTGRAEAGMHRTAPAVSIVVPTFREAANLPLLAGRIDAAMAGTPYELIVIDDDSNDGTEEAMAALAQRLPAHLTVRKGERGLATAVIAGIARARGSVVVVMDADLSHPPESIPALVEPIRAGRTTFTLGSRYRDGGGIDDDWPLHRRVVSLFARELARPLTPLTDPLSGFFAIAASAMPPLSLLSPVGYKIGLELIVKGGIDNVVEVPIQFSDRQHGESKLSAAEQVRYLRHLRRLYQYRYTTLAEFVQFALVGGSGFVLDVTLYLLLQWIGGLPHTTARAISFWPVVTWNWAANRVLTFSHRPHGSRLAQWLHFVVTCCIGFAINYGSYYLLTRYVPFFGEHRLLALVTGVALGMGSNFLMASLFVFRPLREALQVEASQSQRR
jgi:dolichol-phosphate mannosyltransferase